MGEYNYELAYKNTDPFFANLNQDLAELKNVSKIARDVSKLKDYFDVLDNFITHYYSYLPDFSDQLETCEKIVYSVQYNNFFAKDRGMQNLDMKQNREFFIKMIDIRRQLKKIHSQVIQGFVDNDLLPKVIKKKKYDPSKAIIGG